MFARYDSLEAQIGAAFSSWPKGTLDDLKHLVASHPRSSLVLLHFGWALYWSGRNADAIAAWQRAAASEPDSPAAVDAQTALHPTMAPGLPYIVASVAPPAAVAKLPAAAELQALALAAAKPDANAKLLYGIALWNLRRPVSAERQFQAAAALAPHDPTVLTAAAVGRFTKSNPVRAFSRLGPLTGVFPRAARRALPSRPAADLDRAGRRRASNSSGWRLRTARRRSTGSRRGRCWRAYPTMGPSEENDEPNGLWRHVRFAWHSAASSEVVRIN